MRVVHVCGGLGLAACLLSGAPAARAGAAPEWLVRVNLYRASAALPPVTEVASYDAGDAAHSRYLVLNQTLSHTEDPTKPGFSAAGMLAGEQSDVMVDYHTATSDSAAVDLWMTGVFHSIGIVDPALGRAGFGSFRQDQPGEQMGASLNVVGGRGAAPAGTVYPVVWPADGASEPLTAYTGTEAPDPLTSCPGYAAPTGVPLLFQLGPGHLPSVTAYSLSRDGAALPACEIDGLDYANPDPVSQSEGRGVLASRGAAALIPRAPLQAGATYRVSLTAGGATYAWSFSTGAAPPTPGSPPAGATPRAPAPPPTHPVAPRAAPSSPAAVAPAAVPPAAPAPSPVAPRPVAASSPPVEVALAPPAPPAAAPAVDRGPPPADGGWLRPAAIGGGTVEVLAMLLLAVRRRRRRARPAAAR